MAVTDTGGGRGCERGSANPAPHTHTAGRRRWPGGRYQPASGPATVCGVYVETDDRTGLAKRIEPIRVGGRLSQTVPEV